MTDLTAPPIRLLAAIAGRIGRVGRGRSLVLLILALGIGMAASGVVVLVGAITTFLHRLLFGLAPGARLSAQTALSTPALALVPAVGGIILGLTILVVRRYRSRAPVDPMEANAVHGGKMSLRESLVVTAQTVLSSGFGASVGLEAGYTQLSSALASWLGGNLRLRRNEVRLLVGCGAAAAIAAAFDAPFTGVFYAFELIIGVYSAAMLAPVLAAALFASFLTRGVGGEQFPLVTGAVPLLSAGDVVPFLSLGVLCAVVSIAIMVAVAWIERGFAALRMPPPVRPVFGGLAVGAMALLSPAVLSTGHGALNSPWLVGSGLVTIGLLFLLKALASAISLGAGFRGGLFFASLLMGALFGRLYGGLLVDAGLAPHFDIQLATVVGMASLAAGIVGGPLTMTFLVLEGTGDLAISAAVMVAATIAALLVREMFGYSFSTWRLHLRGENILAPHDVGRVRNLTVERLMRADVATIGQRTTLAEFRRAFPLGSTKRVVVTDANGRYVGIVLVADAYQPRPAEAADEGIEALLRYRDQFLLPGLNVADAAKVFQRAESEELAVLDNLGNRHVIGLLTEAHLLRRYSEELDQGLKDLTG